MELFFTISLVMCMIAPASSRSYSRGSLFNVMNFGAVGDGATDDSQAFGKAWNAVCGDTSDNPTFHVPPGKTFLLQPIIFQGPCKSSNLHVQIRGNLIAPKGPSNWKGMDQNTWLSFTNINEFTVDGNGQIDGQGSHWWDLCLDDCPKPSALVFLKCSNFQVNGLKHINSQRNHISLVNCEDATLSNLHISAPETSPNTDGIDISASNNIKILNSIIATGDDCLAIDTGCSQINLTGLTCGPGHGISIGSLGKSGEAAAVEEVHVKNCSLKSTQNGLRIKSWQTSAVKISDVSYIGVHGTSIAQDAIALNCSRTVGCDNIVLHHINITMSSTNPNTRTYSNCINAHGKYSDSLPSVDCLR